MIRNQNRSKWFGASDTSMIMGNWETETFKEWWLVKLGIQINNVRSWAMDCGNIMEVPIIRFIEKAENKKIKIGKRPYYNLRLRLRCNYDGLRKDEVVEIKTTRKGFTRIPKNYWLQCQVLMYKKRKLKTTLYEYRMTDTDYLNPYFPEIDKNRLFKHQILFDRGFIEKEYLPRLRYLAICLKARKFPKVDEYVQNYSKK